MSEKESEKKEYTTPEITRRETLESFSATDAGAGMLAGSAFPGQGRGPVDGRGEGKDANDGEESGRGPPEDSNGRRRGQPDRGEDED